jgi:protease-4
MHHANYQTRRRPGCLFTFVLLLIIGLLLAWFLPPPPEHSMLASWFSSPVESIGADEYPDLDEIWSEGYGTNKVVRIPLNGLIMLDQSSSGIFGGVSSSDMARLAIRRATADPDVQAIIMDVDSGGGGVTASDILYHALLNFKASDPRRRVVTICGDMAASGAYYIALASDRIIARPTTVTGSIGVIIQSVNVRELATRFGIADVTYKSGENKDLLNPMGEMSDQKRDIMQAVVDAMHQRFVSLVAKHRSIPEEKLDSLTDGRIFTAESALANGLIDQIGYWEDAISQTQDLLGVPDIIIYRYEESFSLSALLSAVKEINPRAWLGRQDTARLQYRLSL